MPCRISTANHLDGLADEIAAGIWSATRGSGVKQDIPWSDAPEHWPVAYTRHAHIVIGVARVEHGHG